MIRVLAFVEGTAITGPAKNLLAFSKQLQTGADPPPVALEIATYLRPRQSKDNDLTRALADHCIPLHFIPERFTFDPHVLREISQLIRRVNPDIVQTHSIKSHFLLRLSGQWQRLPWVAFHHGYTYTVPRLRLYNQLDRWSLRRCSRVVVVSKAFQQDLIDKGISPEKIETLHNAVDPQWGERARDARLRFATRSALGLSSQDKLIVIVGRLSLEKSHVLLVRAVARLLKAMPEQPVHLLIVGDGPEKATIEQTAAAAGIAGRVTLTGYAADVLPYYSASDIAVLASITEGSPNALLEALAAQLPVVATAVGGIPEIVSDPDTALLVPPGDEAALAEALETVLRQWPAAKERASRAHDYVLRHHTPEQRTRRLCDFYERLISPSRPKVVI